eukprot:355329-Rhodomonas_salina.1
MTTHPIAPYAISVPLIPYHHTLSQYTISTRAIIRYLSTAHRVLSYDISVPLIPCHHTSVPLIAYHHTLSQYSSLPSTIR